MQTETVQTAFPFTNFVPVLSAEELALREHALCRHDADHLSNLVRGWDRRNAPEGLTYLGQGADKITYALPCGHHVLKLDRGKHCFGDQLTKEFCIWEEASPERRRDLCPIDGWGEDWLLARRARRDNLEEAVNNFWGRYPDVCAANVGWVGSRPVLIDYGYWGASTVASISTFS